MARSFYAWLAVGFAVAGVVVYFAALMCTHIAAFRTGNNMRKAATHHLSKVPLGYYDEHSTGELRRVIDGCAGQTESVLAISSLIRGSPHHPRSCLSS